MTTAFSSLGDTIGRIFGRITGKTETFGSTFGKVFGVAIEIALELAKNIIKAIDGVLKGVEFVIDKFSNFIKFINEGLANIDWSALKPDFSDWEFPSLKFWESDTKKATKSVKDLNKATKAVSSFKVNDPDAIAKAARLTKQIEASQKLIIKQATAVMSAVKSMVDQSQNALSSIDWSLHGKRMMDTLAAGMKARAFVVVDQIKATMKDVRNYLPKSPAKVGPLSDIHKLKFSETIAKSIKAGPMVKAMRAATLATRAAANDNQFGALSRAELSRGSITRSNIQAQARRSASNSAGGTVINYAPTITIEGSSPDAEKRFKELLKEHSREIKKVVDDENNRVARRSYG